MQTIIKITKQEAIEAWKVQNKHISKGEDTIVEIEEDKINELSNYLIKTQPLISDSTTGEWCKACGIWKQYGVPDNHYCTGYKVTC